LEYLNDFSTACEQSPGSVADEGMFKQLDEQPSIINRQLAISNAQWAIGNRQLAIRKEEAAVSGILHLASWF